MKSAHFFMVIKLTFIEKSAQKKSARIFFADFFVRGFFSRTFLCACMFFFFAY